MEHQVGLQTVAVSIVGYVTMKVGGIGPKVANAAYGLLCVINSALT